MASPIPSDAYLMALRRDLERLEMGMQRWSEQIQYYERAIMLNANDPKTLDDYRFMLHHTRVHRADYKDMYNFRAFQILLFSQARFDKFGGIIEAVLVKGKFSSSLEEATRTDPDLLAGDRIFFSDQK